MPEKKCGAIFRLEILARVTAPYLCVLGVEAAVLC